MTPYGWQTAHSATKSGSTELDVEFCTKNVDKIVSKATHSQQSL